MAMIAEEFNMHDIQRDRRGPVCTPCCSFELHAAVLQPWARTPMRAIKRATIAEESNMNAIQQDRRGPCLHLGSAVSLLQG